MMNFMHFVEGRECMKKSMGPIEEEIFNEVDYQHLADEFSERGEVCKPLPHADQWRRRDYEGVDEELVH